jgi:EamA domain-containing membrane protein RarD
MCNLGKIDRIIRAIFGIVIIAVGITMDIWILTGLGIIALTTAAISFCPLYSLLKLNTGCNSKK